MIGLRNRGRATHTKTEVVKTVMAMPRPTASHVSAIRPPAFVSGAVVDDVSPTPPKVRTKGEGGRTGGKGPGEEAADEDGAHVLGERATNLEDDIDAHRDEKDRPAAEHFRRRRPQERALFKTSGLWPKDGEADARGCSRRGRGT